MIMKSNDDKPRGWEALKIMLKEEGLNDQEIEEAELSFRNGINALYKLYILTHPNRSKTP